MLPGQNDPFGNPPGGDDPGFGMPPAFNGGADPTADVTFDFSDTEGMGGGLVPPGTHIARLTNVRKQESNAGNPMVVWDFIVVSDTAPGMTITNFTALTTAAIWKFDEMLAALGLGRRFQRSEALNRMCVINVEHGEYRGRPTANIVSAAPHPNGVGTKWQMSGMPTPPTNI